MRVSEITAAIAAQYARAEEDTALIGAVYLPAAVAYVKSYTGLDAVALDLHEEISIAVLVLVADMYDTRSMTVENDKVNRVIDTIIGMHSVNFL